MTYIICLNNKYNFTEADQQEASNLYHITRKIIYFLTISQLLIHMYLSARVGALLSFWTAVLHTGSKNSTSKCD